MRSPLPSIPGSSRFPAAAPAAEAPNVRASRFGLPRDPRWYQIAALAGLLAWGVLGLSFDIGPAQLAVTLGTALAVQWIGDRFARRAPFEPRSALISGLSLCLLLRTDRLELAMLASAIAIGSKFVVRVRGKHLFNPTNGAIVALLALGLPVWVSAGQWGNAAFFAFAIACAGLVVVTRAARADVTIAFLLFWAVLLFGRAQFLGQRFAVPLHQLGSGALLLYAFFMISDPRTTPDTRAGRVLFAALVAAGAGFVTFVLYRPNGLLWALAALSLIVPLIDRALPGARYDWSRPRRPGRDSRPEGDLHETFPAAGFTPAAAAGARARA